MKNYIFSFLILTIFGLSVAAQTDFKSGNLFADINKMNGADSGTLLNELKIKIRLQKLLGAEHYAAFLGSFETVTPVGKKGKSLFASGCLIHARGHLESAIAIDLVNKTIHAAIYNEKKKTGYFNENKSKTPSVIKNWASLLAERKQ